MLENVQYFEMITELVRGFEIVSDALLTRDVAVASVQAVLYVAALGYFVTQLLSLSPPPSPPLSPSLPTSLFLSHASHAVN